MSFYMTYNTRVLKKWPFYLQKIISQYYPINTGFTPPLTPLWLSYIRNNNIKFIIKIVFHAIYTKNEFRSYKEHVIFHWSNILTYVYAIIEKFHVYDLTDQSCWHSFCYG